MTRRTFVEAFMVGGTGRGAQGQSGPEVPRRPLGHTGLEVSVLGIGGYHLGSANSDAEAMQIVSEALDAGVNLFASPWEYHNGLSESPPVPPLNAKRAPPVL